MRDALKAAQSRRPSANKLEAAVRVTQSGAVLERGSGRLIQGPAAAAASPSPMEARHDTRRALYVHPGAARVVAERERQLTAVASAPGRFLVPAG